MKSSLCVVFTVALIVIVLTCAWSAPTSLNGYIKQAPSETATEREQRHMLVAKRRSGTIVTVHRGATAFAPENTLEAYAAAMDYGADGCEVDVRRTDDGVLVLFHDDMLDRLTDGFGVLNQLTYYELLSLQPRYIYGRANKDTRLPTFAALLTLAQQRAMLLHLDIKEPGIEGDIIKMLDATDMWDHVVSVSSYNSEELQKNPSFKPLQYKAPGLFEDRSDMSLEGVKTALAKPGQMIIVDDPRIAAKVLGREPYKPVALPQALKMVWAAPNASADAGFVPQRYVRSLESITTPGKLLGLINANPGYRTKLDGNDAYQQARLQGILARALAIRKYAQITPKPDKLTAVLEEQVRKRSLHNDWLFHGLDGTSAVRALVQLGATESVPALINTFRQIDPELSQVSFGTGSIGVADWRIKSDIIEALGKLQCKQSKEFLLSYVKMDEGQVKEMCFPMYAEAAKSLMKQALTASEIESLLKSTQSQVRGEALLYCIDHPSKERAEAVRKPAPWALELPSE